MLDFETFKHQASKVPCITWSHSQFLYGLAKWFRPQTIVEVGSWHGGSAVWLARALQEMNNQGRLYCIDDFGNHKALKPTTVGVLYSHLCDCGVEDMTDILFGKSQEVIWPKKVDLAFIDGNHTFSSCEWDVNQAIERGATCIAVHDTYSTYGTRGPRKWLKKFRDKKLSEWGIIEVPFDEGLAVAIKNPLTEPKKIFS